MTDSRKVEAPRTLHAWRWWLPPALLSLSLALIFIDPFAGDWDALDYTVLALEGQPSSMVLGRMLFIFANRALYLIGHQLFGLRPEQAYLLFKYAVVAQTPLAIVACWVLARDLTRSVRSATVSVLLLACSPFFVIYSGQAMTEIPSILLLAAALVIHLRGLRRRNVWLVLVGAGLLGLGVNVREAAALYGPWLVIAPVACGWKLKPREIALTALACLVFFVCALGPFAYWYAMDVDNYRRAWRGWALDTQSEAARHPITPNNFGSLLNYFYIAAPLALFASPAAFVREWRERGFTPLLALGAVGLFSNLMLVTHYSLVLNGRYLLTGLPGVVPLVADALVRAQTAHVGDVRRAFTRVALSVAVVAIVFGSRPFIAMRQGTEGHALTKGYDRRLALLPRDAVVIPGMQTVSVTYWRGIGAGEWEVIGTGARWPARRLAEVVENYLKEGRRVFLDADPRWWTTRGWQAEETREVTRLGSQFRFRRVAENLYEVRPPDDPEAKDMPNWQPLLFDD